MVTVENVISEATFRVAIGEVEKRSGEIRSEDTVGEWEYLAVPFSVSLDKPSVSVCGGLLWFDGMRLCAARDVLGRNVPEWVASIVSPHAAEKVRGYLAD